MKKPSKYIGHRNPSIIPDDITPKIKSDFNVDQFKAFREAMFEIIAI